MEKVCEHIQESIALGSSLNEDSNNHLKICEKCGHLFHEYESLTLLISDSSEFEVPLGFADAVMTKIEQDEISKVDDWMQKSVGFLNQLLAKPQLQYLALGLGGAVSLANLARYVFFVIIPLN